MYTQDRHRDSDSTTDSHRSEPHVTVLELLRARSGHFVFESGHHGDLWLDLDVLFDRPARLRPFVNELSDRLRRHGADVVCGPLTGGALVAYLVAARLEVEFRGAAQVTAPTAGALYSATYQLRADPDVQGKRVAVVDDVINAGSATRSTLAALRAAGGVPVAIGAVLVLGAKASELADEQGLALEPVAQRGSALWEPASCPLCGSGMPLTEPTSEES